MKRKRNWDVSFWKKSQCHFIYVVLVCVCCHACNLQCVCACRKSASFFFLFPSVKTNPHTSATLHIPQKKKLISNPLPTPCTSQASQHPAFPSIQIKKTCVLKLQCVRRHCGKLSPPPHSLCLPFLSLLIYFSFRYCFGWVAAGFILMFIKLSNSCPC